MQTNPRAEVMYEITLKYQDWFYSSRLQRPDLFTALGAVLDMGEYATVQWYRVRPLVSEEGALEPSGKAEEVHFAGRAISLHH
jgi:hypothetical protein